MGDREDEEGVAFEALKDPLYRLLVTEARQNVMKYQRKYKEELERLQRIRSGTERFLALYSRTEDLRTRIENTRNTFQATSQFLTELKNQVDIIKQKQAQILLKIDMLTALKSSSVEDIKRLRTEFYDSLKELRDLETAQRTAEAEEYLLQDQLVSLGQELREQGALKDQLHESTQYLLEYINTLNEYIRALKAQLETAKYRSGDITSELSEKRTNLALKQDSLRNLRTELEYLQLLQTYSEYRQEELQSDVQALTYEISNVNAQIDAGTGAIRQLTGELADTNAALDAAAQYLAELKRYFDEASQTLSADNLQLQYLTADLARLRGDNRALGDRRTELYSNVDSKLDYINRLKQYIREIQRSLASNTAELENTRSQSNSAQAHINEYQQQYVALQQQIDTLQQELDSNYSLQALLATDRERDYNTLDYLLNELRDQQARKLDLQYKLEKAQQDLSEANKKLNYSRLLQKIGNAASERDRLRQSNQDLDYQIYTIQEYINRLGMDGVNLQDQHTLERNLRQTLEQLQAAKDRYQYLYEIAAILTSPEVQQLMQTRQQLQDVNYYIEAQKLTEAQVRLQGELEEIIGERLTNASVERALRDLANQLQQGTAQLSDLNTLKDLLYYLQGLKRDKEAAGELSRQAEDIKRTLVNYYGVDPRSLEEAALPDTLTRNQQEVDYLRTKVYEMQRDKALAESQMPLLMRLQTSLEYLKAAQENKDIIAKDLETIMKELREELMKFDVGDMPDMTNLQEIAQYIAKLLDLQERAKLIEMQGHLDTVQKATKELEDLKKRSPEALEQAMQQLINGQIGDLRQLANDITTGLQRHGLSIDDPVKLAEYAKAAKDACDQLARDIQYKVNSVLTKARLQRDTYQSISTVLEHLSEKVGNVKNLLEAGNLYLVPAVKACYVLLAKAATDINIIQTPNVYSPVLETLNTYLKTLESELQTEPVISKIKEVIDAIDKRGDTAKAHLDMLDRLAESLKNVSMATGDIESTLNQLNDKLQDVKNQLLGESKEIVDLGNMIRDSIFKLKTTESNKQRLGFNIEYLSFSFHCDYQGRPIQLPYKPLGAAPGPTMFNVLQVVQYQAQAITTPKYVYDLTAKLQRYRHSQVPEALEQEVDDIVITVWVYDMIYQFRTQFQKNIKMATNVVAEMTSELNQLALTPQISADMVSILQSVSGKIYEVTLKYKQDMKDISKMFFVSVVPPSANKTLPYEQVMEYMEKKLDYVYKTQYLYGLLPDTYLITPNLVKDPQGVFKDYQSKNDIGLMINAMSTAYTANAQYSSDAQEHATKAFTEFLSRFNKIVKGQAGTDIIALYNASTLDSQRSLDKFVRAILANTIKPSQTLLDSLKIIKQYIVNIKDIYYQQQSEMQYVIYAARGPLPELNQRRAPPTAMAVSRKARVAFTGRLPSRSYKSISFNHVLDFF